MRVAKVRKTGVRVQFRKMQPDPCFSPYRRDSERALTRFARFERNNGLRPRYRVIVSLSFCLAICRSLRRMLAL